MLSSAVRRRHGAGPASGSLLVRVACISLAVLAPALGAQNQRGTGITITVRDSGGFGISGAELTSTGGSQHAVSDDLGTFHLVGVIAGPSTFHIRRLGFRPDSLKLEIAPGMQTSHTVVLQRVVQTLAPITVQGTVAAQGRLAGFWQRRLTGNGHFFTKNDIEHQNLMQMTDLFRMIPGMRLVTRGGLGRNQIRMRGASSSCWPLVWLDNNPLGAGEFDLDNIQPNSVEALEVYAGPAQVPAQFMGPRGLGSCGVIVLWSREGERKQKKIKNAVTASQLAEMVASLKVYTADQVEHPAVADSSLMTAPQYPDSLFAAAASGLVLAEFVVDTLGHVEQETFGVVQTTNPLFTESVRRAVFDAQFRPASHQGHRVRQVVTLPFKFIPDSSVVRRSMREELN